MPRARRGGQNRTDGRGHFALLPFDGQSAATGAAEAGEAGAPTA